ncbi:Zinc finger protein ZAT11 [Sesamum alatum]|uniref:Zinc finger protein ZAT11 n=1 Tax=Sesamum alatum TaxID=300844 RepID=A0AAE1Y7U8_9LAMI|nr:Zinc finger protein ZAT11 [Sesamum alatum]
MMMMKRTREEAAHDGNITALANCLMLLSSRGQERGRGGGEEYSTRVFTCKTCNRQFPSFQALGGHRASHKKPRLMAGGGDERPLSPLKPKAHECSICGLEFPIGQALGGHMRRHRAVVVGDDQHLRPAAAVPEGPVVKRANSRRVLCVDLNLTPLENKFVFGDGINNPAHVDCFF